MKTIFHKNGTRLRTKPKEVRIREIQAAARRVFFKQHYLSTTLDEIAKEAGVAKGTIYLYFQNKDDLYISLMEGTAEALLKRMMKFEHQMDRLEFRNGKEIIMKILDIFYMWLQSDPDGFTIATSFQQGGFLSRMSQNTLQRINVIGKAGFSCIRRIISKGKERGLIRRKIDNTVLSDILYSTFLGLAQFEQNKTLFTKKDHIYSTLKQAYTLIGNSICNDREEID